MDSTCLRGNSQEIVVQEFAEIRDWKKRQPDIVADAVIKRAEVGKIGRILRTRLAFAQFKVARGWEDLTIDAIEPKVDELLPISSEEIFSKSSSPSTSDTFHRNSKDPRTNHLSTFSDHIVLDGRISQGRDAYRKRRCHHSFDDSEIRTGNPIKRYRSSPPSASSIIYREIRQPFSSPIKTRTNPHFTTARGPHLQFSTNSYQRNFQIYHSDFDSEDEETRLPMYPLHLNSSPPCTPPSLSHRARVDQLKTEKNRDFHKTGLDLLHNLTKSPPNTISTRAPNPPTTPPHQNSALLSSMVSTPRRSNVAVSGSGFCGSPNTPSQAFEFSDFVNITPSPVRSNWPITPRTKKS